MLFTDRVTVLRARRVRGPYGGWELDWDDPVEDPVPFGVAVHPRTSSESEDHTRVHLQTGWRLITQPGFHLEVSATDRIRVESQPGDDGGPLVLHVDGAPAHFRTPILPHTEIDLEVRNG